MTSKFYYDNCYRTPERAADQLLFPPMKLVRWSKIVYEMTLKHTNRLTEEEWLWTDESVSCICTHHVEHYYTVRDRYGRLTTIYCDSRSSIDENCSCPLFRPRSMKINSLTEVAT
jgi:hypothetical protein